MDSPYRNEVGYTMLSAFGHLLLGSVLSNRQSLMLRHSKSDWDTPTERINIRKVCSNVSVARLKLLTNQAGNSPVRRFQLEP